MKNSSTKTMVIVICLIVIVVAFFGYQANRTRSLQSQKTTLTKVENALLRDLENNYPPTVKEVIKYYNEITMCFYNEECTEEEIIQLAEKAYQLYDEELAMHNDWTSYLTQLNLEIKDYNENKRKISSITLAASTDVDYFTQDGFSFARIRCIYNVKEGSASQPVNQVFLLRKDEENHWKIYGWDLAGNLFLNVQ